MHFLTRLICCSLLSALPLVAKVDYCFTNDPVDVVIPCTEKDLLTLPLCLKGIKDHGKNIRRVIVVSKHKLTSDAEWFPEDNYPFSKTDVALILLGDELAAEDYLSDPSNRAGWLLQQLLKFYAVYLIPGISSNILFLDADTVFLRDITFQNPKSNAGIFNVGTEYHHPYFSHGKRLIPGFGKYMKKHSGICHWMLMQKPILDHLFEVVESYHKMPFWQAFCSCVDKNEILLSCASEYEIYFNFSKMKSIYFQFQPLKWDNVCSLEAIDAARLENYDYVSCHRFLRDIGANE